MSSFKGKTVKNKSKLRQEKKVLEELSRQEGNPLKEIMDRVNSEEIKQEVLDKVRKQFKII